MIARLGELWGAKDVLQKLAKTKFKAKVSYKLMKVIDQANKEFEPFSKVRMELFTKYGEKKDDTITIKPENIEQFSNEMSELEATEVEIKFSISLEEIAEAELTPSELYLLDFMFRDEIAASQSEDNKE